MQVLRPIVREAVGSELVLTQWVPIFAATSNQWVPIESEPLVQVADVTPDAITEYPLVDDVVES
jgi:hypothetical protein